MRRCARSEELRQALAAGEPLAAEIAAHVAGCSECAGLRADARRFDARLDTALAELITDALPPSTATVARATPRYASRRPSPRILISTFAMIAVVAFAVIGVVATGASISDSLRAGEPAGAGPADEAGLLQVDCYLGEPTVEVVGETTGGAPTALIAYCIGGMDSGTVFGGSGVSCVQSADGAARHLLRRSREGASDENDERGAYLGACTRVEYVESVLPVAESTRTALPQPLGSWSEAAEMVAWPVVEPGWMPDGYALAALQGFGQRADPEAITAVVGTYLRSGTPLTIEQFTIADPEAFRVELSIPGDDLDKVSTGRTTVGGNSAFWATGLGVATVGGPPLDVDTMVLTWSDGRVGYRLTSREDDLGTLRRIATSLVDA